MVMASIPTIMSTTSSCQPHHHVNHIIIISLSCQPMWLLGSPVGSLFPRVRGSIWESCRQKVHRTVERAWFALQYVIKLACSEHFWKIRAAKSARDSSESSIPRKKRKKELWRSEFMWLSPRCWRCTKVGQFGGALLLCEFATRCDIGTAPCSKAWVILRRSRQAGLQLVEVAKRNVTAARREKSGCRSYKRASWEAAQSRSSPDKWLLREEVAERRGASAKWSLSEEVAQQRNASSSPIHPSIHSSIHPSITSCIASLIHGITDSLIHWFIDSLNHWFTESVTHWFIDLLIHCFIDSLIHSVIDSSTHQFTRALIHRLVFTESPIHWVIDSLNHRFIKSSVLSSIDSLNHWFIGSSTH